MKLSWFSLPCSLPPPPAAQSLVPAVLPFGCSAGTVPGDIRVPVDLSVSRLFLCMSITSAHPSRAQRLLAAIQLLWLQVSAARAASLVVWVSSLYTQIQLCMWRSLR